MDTETITLSTMDYLDRANFFLEKKEILSFMENIGSAMALAKNTKKDLANTTLLKSKGLIIFNQHKLALKSIAEALKYNESVVEKFRLLKYQGIAWGYLGHLHKAKDQFLQLEQDTQEPPLLIEVYNNLVWIFLSLYQSESKKEDYLHATKKYLDLTKDSFYLLTDYQKQVYYTNSGQYYSLLKKFDKAIAKLEKAIPYSDEYHLPEIYNNLAFLHLESDELAVSDKLSDYTAKAEVIASKYKNDLEIGKALYTKAKAELKDEQFLKAIDGLYVAFDHFKKSEAFALALDCISLISEIVNEFKIECMDSFIKSLQVQIKEQSDLSKL